jgi:hypothetical protein
MPNRRAHAAVSACALAWLTGVAVAWATDVEPDADSFEASPAAGRNLVRGKIGYTHADEGGDQTELLLRANLVYHAVLIPGVRVGAWESLFRVDVRLASDHVADTHAAGFKDLELLQAVGHMIAALGIAGGFRCVLPTASDDALGSGKLQLGPAVATMYVGLPGARLGFIIENLWSLAGDTTRPDIDRLRVQPLASYRFGERLFVATDPILQFDWSKGGLATVPVNAEVGVTFGPHLSLQVGPEWIATGSGKNDVTVDLTIDYKKW